MKSYIITIIGATLLSSVGVMLTPENMRKYVSIITGFIIISAIVAPLSALRDIDIFSGLDDISTNTQNYEEIYSASVLGALSARIEEDIKERLKDEFDYTGDVSVRILAENTNIKSIAEIILHSHVSDNKIVPRLMEVYNVNEVVLNGKRYIKKNSQKQE